MDIEMTRDELYYALKDQKLRADRLEAQLHDAWAASLALDEDCEALKVKHERLFKRIHDALGTPKGQDLMARIRHLRSLVRE